MRQVPVRLLLLHAKIGFRLLVATRNIEINDFLFGPLPRLDSPLCPRMLIYASLKLYFNPQISLLTSLLIQHIYLFWRLWDTLDIVYAALFDGLLVLFIKYTFLLRRGSCPVVFSPVGLTTIFILELFNIESDSWGEPGTLILWYLGSISCSDEIVGAVEIMRMRSIWLNGLPSSVTHVLL